MGEKYIEYVADSVVDLTEMSFESKIAGRIPQYWVILPYRDTKITLRRIKRGFCDDDGYIGSHTYSSFFKYIEEYFGVPEEMYESVWTEYYHRMRYYLNSLKEN